MAVERCDSTVFVRTRSPSEQSDYGLHPDIEVGLLPLMSCGGEKAVRPQRAFHIPDEFATEDCSSQASTKASEKPALRLHMLVGTWYRNTDSQIRWDVEEDGTTWFNGARVDSKYHFFEEQNEDGTLEVFCPQHKANGEEIDHERSSEQQVVWTLNGVFSATWNRRSQGGFQSAVRAEPLCIPLQAPPEYAAALQMARMMSPSLFAPAFMLPGVGASKSVDPSDSRSAENFAGKRWGDPPPATWTSAASGGRQSAMYEQSFDEHKGACYPQQQSYDVINGAGYPQLSRASGAQVRHQDAEVNGAGYPQQSYDERNGASYPQRSRAGTAQARPQDAEVNGAGYPQQSYDERNGASYPQLSRAVTAQATLGGPSPTNSQHQGHGMAPAQQAPPMGQFHQRPMAQAQGPQLGRVMTAPCGAQPLMMPQMPMGPMVLNGNGMAPVMGPGNWVMVPVNSQMAPATSSSVPPGNNGPASSSSSSKRPVLERCVEGAGSEGTSSPSASRHERTPPRTTTPPGCFSAKKPVPAGEMIRHVADVSEEELRQIAKAALSVVPGYKQALERQHKPAEKKPKVNKEAAGAKEPRARADSQAAGAKEPRARADSQAAGAQEPRARADSQAKGPEVPGKLSRRAVPAPILTDAISPNNRPSLEAALPCGLVTRRNAKHMNLVSVPETPQSTKSNARSGFGERRGDKHPDSVPSSAARAAASWAARASASRQARADAAREVFRACREAAEDSNVQAA